MYFAIIIMFNIVFFFADQTEDKTMSEKISNISTIDNAVLPKISQKKNPLIVIRF